MLARLAATIVLFLGSSSCKSLLLNHQKPSGIQTLTLSSMKDPEEQELPSHPWIVSSIKGIDQQQQIISSDEKNPSKFHWVIHWDINESILVGDEVGGDSCQDCFNKMIAKSAFVSMPSATQSNGNSSIAYDYDNTSVLRPTHWWDGSPILVEGQDDNDDDDNDTNRPVSPPLYTGWEWPPGCCPYYRTSYKRLAKTFVEHHGSIYLPIYKEIVKRMTPTNQDHSVFHNILPAFFHTIYTLVHTKNAGKMNNDNNMNSIEETTRKQPPPYTFVFRTFGTDLPNIAKAMTAFAQGKHPDFPDFVYPEYELDVSRLYNAKWVPQMSEDDNNYNDNKSKKEYFQYQLFRQQDGSMVASGDEQVLQLLHDTHHGHYVHGIRDDYPMWKSHNWEPWAGKPVWMTDHPTSSSTDDVGVRHHHVLFDDNIHNLPHDGIASVRRKVIDAAANAAGAGSSISSDTNTGRTIRFESLSGTDIQARHGLNLIRVPTIEPILNKDWFLEQVVKVQTAAAAEYAARG